MKIAMFVNSFPAVSETFILGQIVGLLTMGHEVDIYSLQQITKGPVHPQVDQYGLLDRTVYLGNKLPSSSTRKYDIVHCQFGPLGNKFSYLKYLWDAKLVVSFRGYDFSRVPQLQGSIIYSNLFETADAVTVICEHARRRLLDMGCPTERVLKLHSGTDLDTFPFQERTITPDGKVCLLTVARLVEKKGIEYAIQAVALAVKRGAANLQYRIVGQGPLMEQLKSLVVELGLESYVELLGPQAQDKVRDLLLESQIFLLPCVTGHDGNQEGIPGSLREAMATGVPVISTWHSGIPELVRDNESGFLVPERNVPVLADRLTYLINHSERWAEMGRAGRKKVEEHFDQRRLNHRLVELYEHVQAGVLAEFDEGTVAPLVAGG